jgi:hypothetical protein
VDHFGLKARWDWRTWWKRKASESSHSAAFGIEMNERDNTDNRGGHEWRADECVGDAAVVFEALDRAVK